MGRLSDEWKYDEIKPRPAKDREKAAKRIVSLPYEEAVKEMEKLHSEFNIGDYNDISMRIMEKTKGNPDNYGKKPDHKIVNDFAIDAIKDNFTPPGAKKKMARKIRDAEYPDWVWDDEDVLKRFMATPYLNANYSKDMSDEDKAELKENYKAYKKMSIDDFMKSKDFQPFYDYVEDNEEVEPNNYTSKALWGEGDQNPYADLDKLLDEWDKEDVKDTIDTNDNGKIEVDEMADFQKSLDDYASKNKKGRDDIPVTTRR